MEVVLKHLFALVLLVYYSIANTIKFFIPYKFRSKSIKNEIVLVTGAGSGIGKSIAKKLGKLEAVLVLWDVDEASNKQTATEINEDGGKAFAYRCDLTKRDDIYKVAKQVQSDIGNVTILVNNAGIVSGKPILELTDTQIDRTMQVNCMAHFWTVKSFLPHMLDKNHGHIVSIASMAGLSGSASLTDYCASKFGAVGLHESLGNEFIRLGKSGIKTTVVCPTGVNTGLFSGFSLKGIPMMNTDYVAERTVEALLTNQKMLLLPRQMYILMALKWLLPLQVAEYLGELTEVHKAMDNFVGRKKDN